MLKHEHLQTLAVSVTVAALSPSVPSRRLEFCCLGDLYDRQTDLKDELRPYLSASLCILVISSPAIFQRKTTENRETESEISQKTVLLFSAISLELTAGKSKKRPLCPSSNPTFRRKGI